MKILVADDEEPKLASIVDWLSIFCSSSEIVTARSVRSAIDVILDAKPELVLLDMSLPTFDVSPGETGGGLKGLAE